MIIKNIGSVKDVKINGILIRIAPGINVIKDNKILENIVRLNKDLTILKEIPVKLKDLQKEMKTIEPVKVELVLDEKLVPGLVNTIKKYKKGKKYNAPDNS